MGITEKQRQRRTSYLGSSDAAVILGASLYKTKPTDIYWSKVTPLPAEDGVPKYMMVGNYIEDALLRFFEDATNSKIVRNQFRVAKDGRGKGVFAANCDAITEDTNEIVEAKYVNAENAKLYGIEHTNEVPPQVIIQVQHQMYCTGAEKAWVVAALAGYSLDMKMYCVQRDEELIELIVNQCMDWWDKYVKTKTPPPGGETPPIAFLEAIERESQSVVQLDKNIIMLAEEFEEAKIEEKKWKDAVAELRTKLIQSLGKNEIGQLPDGRTVEYLPRTSKRFSVTAFRADYPDLAEQYSQKSTYRTLYIKKAKKGTKQNGEESKKAGATTAA